MAAGGLSARKVKSHQKLAYVGDGRVQVAANSGTIQLAQADYYYGWAFDDGIDEYYYWYPASEVVVDETFVEYYG